MSTPVIGWTDLPFPEFGDPSPRSMRESWEAPRRRVEVVSWNRDKYCCARVFDGDEVLHVNLKRWYLYPVGKGGDGTGQFTEEVLRPLPQSCGDDCPWDRTRCFDRHWHLLPKETT